MHTAAQIDMEFWIRGEMFMTAAKFDSQEAFKIRCANFHKMMLSGKYGRYATSQPEVDLDTAFQPFARTTAEEWFLSASIIEIAEYAVANKIAIVNENPLALAIGWDEKIIAHKTQSLLESAS